MTSSLAHLISRADADRRALRWSEARSGYREVLSQKMDAVVAHNLAVCHLALGEPREALEASEFALQLSTALWQTSMVQVVALEALGERDRALSTLLLLKSKFDDNIDIAIAAAKSLLQHGGDADGAARIAEPLIGCKPGSEAESIFLMARLYDRGPSLTGRVLTSRIRRFAASNLSLKTKSGKRHPRVSVRPRLRVGLISPKFTASPVYFFAYGVLKRLAQSVDLHFFSRGQRTDWATQAFQSIANDWSVVAGASADHLSATLRRSDLDIVIDLGGWMDLDGLKALSARPARRQFKWVGGQSCTTGLKCFDGFFTDRYQTPAGAEQFYSEPLIRLKHGYVTYTPPGYLPKAIKADPGAGSIRLGVIANPAKISNAFLFDLRERLPLWSKKAARSGKTLSLCFIEARFSQDAVKRRIGAALDAFLLARPGLPIDIEFLVPRGHLDFLRAVASLDAMIDTWPYSGGLTAIEALAMGVPVYSRVGDLFCERHTVSHCFFSGLRPSQFRVEQFSGVPSTSKTGISLIHPSSARLNHDALADEIFQHFTSTDSV